MAVTAAIVGGTLAAGANIAGSALGGRQASRGFGRAIGATRDFQQRLRDFIEQTQGQAGGFLGIAQPEFAARSEAAQAALPAIQQLALHPTTTEGFKIAAKEGLQQLAANYAPGGSPFSGPAQTAAGSFLARLLAGERDAQRQTLFKLAGLSDPYRAGALGASLTGTAASGFGPLQQSTQDLASLYTGRGAQRAATTQGIFNTLGGLFDPTGGNILGKIGGLF